MMKSHLNNASAPGGRVPPPELVANLRELNPDAELVYGGRGWWMLGTVRRDRVNQVKIGRTIGALKLVLNYAAPGGEAHVDAGSRPSIDLADPEVRWELWQRLWLKQLAYQGFRLVVRFPEQMLDTAIVGIYEQGRWVRRNREAAEAVEAEASKVIDDSGRNRSIVRDKLEADHRSIHRHAFRHRKQVLNDVPDYNTRVGKTTTPAGIMN